MVNEGGPCGPLLSGGRLLVATFLLPDTISFQIPTRDKDSGRFSRSSLGSNSLRSCPSPRTATTSSLKAPRYRPPLNRAGLGVDLGHELSVQDPARVEVISSGASAVSSGATPSGELGGDRHLRLDQDRATAGLPHQPPPQRSQYHQLHPSPDIPVPSILAQPPESSLGQDSLFPTTAPMRPTLHQPRRRASRLNESSLLHHHRSLSSSFHGQSAPALPSTESESASASAALVSTTTLTSASASDPSESQGPSLAGFNGFHGPDDSFMQAVKAAVTSAAASVTTTSSITPVTPPTYQRRISSDSAKVFADAPWTVERAPGGNIGLQNAVHSILDQLHPSSQQLWVGTLGMATDALTDKTRRDIQSELALNHHSIPVFVNDQDFEGHYHQFCKQILWPIFHYVMPDNLRGKGYEDRSWKHYVAVNRAFADTIIENYVEGDTIWVNDYHLMLVPNMIRERLPNASIGFFLHIPFPSSEIFRCLHARKEVLEGLLGADLVGFQTYSFARHFLQTCSRILALESTPTGIQLENTAVNIGIFPIGIDPITLNKKRQDPEVAKWVQVLKEKYAGKKLIVARDKLDYIKGVRQKMLAFERFLNLYPEYQGKIVLIQVALSTSEQNEVQGQVSDVVTRINSKFSDLSYQPIVFLHQDITFSQYLGLLTAADLCLITSLRDGMNLTSHEYVACQEEGKNPLVLSEFAGTYGSLGACLRVNPWNYTEVATAIRDALEMKPQEKTIRWNELHKHVCTNTAQFWASGFVSELIKVHGDIQRRYSIHIPHLDMQAILPQYRQAKRRLLLLDYDGTLLPYERPSVVRSKGATSGVPRSGNLKGAFKSGTGLATPAISSAASSPSTFSPAVFGSSASPTEEMLRIVTELARDPCNIVYIMSGRTQESLERTFGSIPNLGLCAEGGCFLKRHGPGSQWENQVTQSSQNGEVAQWRKKVMEMFEYYKERTPGSEIEEKNVPLVWHYRQADNPSFGLWQARECQNHIEEAIGSIYPVHAVVGRKCLEVMPRDVSKACATRTIVESLVHQYRKREWREEQRRRKANGNNHRHADSHGSTASTSSLASLSSEQSLDSNALLSKGGENDGAEKETDVDSDGALFSLGPIPIDFVLCIGDDRSDEDMFQFVNRLQLRGEERDEEEEEEEEEDHRVPKSVADVASCKAVTCTVGCKSSEARWFVPGVPSVLQGLQMMIDTTIFTSQ